VVFARTTPHQKLQIVEHLQAMDHIVAVTGDGVNDSPALKRAEIGIAMGSGADVAKASGDVILMDDNFASIVAGIREGRTIFDNLRKTIAYTCTHLVPETMPTIFNLTYGLPQAISGLQVLCIDCGTELAPAISFAYEHAEADVMLFPPRNHKTDRMVSLPVAIYIFVAGFVESLVAILAFYLYFSARGIVPSALSGTGANYFELGANPDNFGSSTTYTDAQQVELLAESETIYWITLVMQQFCHIWWVKTRHVPIWEHGIFSNVVMLFAVIVEASLVLTIAYAAPFQSFFGTASFSPASLWAIFLLGGFILFLLNEPRKLLLRAFPKSWVRYLSW